MAGNSRSTHSWLDGNRRSILTFRAERRRAALTRADRNEQLALIEGHRAGIRARLSELEVALDAIERKIARYGGSRTP